MVAKDSGLLFSFPLFIVYQSGHVRLCCSIRNNLKKYSDLDWQKFIFYTPCGLAGALLYAILILGPRLME